MMKNNRKSGILLSYVNTFLTMLCGLFLSSFLIRMFGDTDYGIYQTICSFISYLILLEFGVGTVISRNIARCRAKGDSDEEIEKNISTIWTITILLSLLILFVACIFYCCIGNIYSKTLTLEQIEYAKKIFVFEGIYLIISFLSNITNGIFMGYERYNILPIISIIKLIIRTILLVCLAFLNRHAIIIAIVDCIVEFAFIIFCFSYCIFNLKAKFTFKYFDLQIFKEALPLCLAILIQVLVNQANSSVDKFLLGIKVSPESVSVYSVGLYIYSIFSSLTTIPISIYGPQVVKDVTNGATENEVATRMVQPSRIIVLIGGSVLFGFVACGRQFVQILYGEKYLKAWYVAIIIMMPMLINMANGILINILDAENKRIVRSFILLITTIANIILTIFWIDWLDIIGACLATAICTLLGQIMLTNIYYSKNLKIKVLSMYLSVFKGILIYQIIAGILGYFISLLISNVYLSFIIGGITYVLIFGLFFVLFGANREEKNILKKTLKIRKNSL